MWGLGFRVWGLGFEDRECVRGPLISLFGFRSRRIPMANENRCSNCNALIKRAGLCGQCDQGSPLADKRRSLGDVLNPRCAQCGISETERFRWLRAKEAGGAYVLWEHWPVLLYCEDCHKHFCGGCQIDLGQTAGCPVCRYDLTEMRSAANPDVIAQAEPDPAQLEALVEDLYAKWRADPRPDRFDTALMRAANWGDLKGVRALLAVGHKEWDRPNYHDSSAFGKSTGSTALFHAASRGHVEVVNCLIEAGADVNMGDKEGSTALISAVRFGRKECMEALIAAGADPNATPKNAFGIGWTALKYAIWDVHPDSVSRLIAAGADVNARGRDGDTPLIDLMRAASSEYHHSWDILNIIQALVAAGADVNAKNGGGRSALWNAATIGGASGGGAEVVKALIAAGADVNARDGDGVSALMKAAGELCGLDSVLALVAAGANVNAKDRSGETALMKAASDGHGDTVEALIAAGADVYAKDGGGNTALRKALDGMMDSASILALVAAGADANTRNRNGDTALMRRWGNADVLKVLVAAGADVNARDKDGVTTLMEAARYGCADAVNALVAAGADVKLKDKNGKTALALADRVRHPEIVAALKAATPGHRWWPF